MSKHRLKREQVEGWVFLLLVGGLIGLGGYIMIIFWP